MSSQKNSSSLKYFVVGIAIGVTIVFLSYGPVQQRLKNTAHSIYKKIKAAYPSSRKFTKGHSLDETFSQALTAQTGQTFGKRKQLTFELYRGGTFIIDGKSGYALQKSGSYRDSAWIRSTKPLPRTYKISALVGEIDYGLEKIKNLPSDPQYSEGPQNENGCYLLSITDVRPSGHHDNIWWHQHRKVVIDVDNNVWGSGMPNPIFMVYFDKDNQLMSFDGEGNAWKKDWTNAFTYDPKAWYRIEIEKTRRQFIMSIYTEKGDLLKRANVPLNKIWNENGQHPDYFVIGDPHENYYQGSMKIREISIAH